MSWEELAFPGKFGLLERYSICAHTITCHGNSSLRTKDYSECISIKAIAVGWSGSVSAYLCG